MNEAELRAIAGALTAETMRPITEVLSRMMSLLERLSDRVEILERLELERLHQRPSE